MRFPDLINEIHRLNYELQSLGFEVRQLQRVACRLPGGEALDPGPGPWDLDLTDRPYVAKHGSEAWRA